MGESWSVAMFRWIGIVAERPPTLRAVGAGIKTKHNFQRGTDWPAAPDKSRMDWPIGSHVILASRFSTDG